MTTSLRRTINDLESFPDVGGKRDEIIDGELFVSTQTHWHHQNVCLRLGRHLDEWNEQTGAGVASLAPGIVFADHDAVAPDAARISNERLKSALDSGDHLRLAPERVVEVRSPGSTNERRDREAKLKLYSNAVFTNTGSLTGDCGRWKCTGAIRRRCG